MGASAKGKDDDPLGSTLQVSSSLLHGSEDRSGLHHILSTSITPFDVGDISLLENGDGLSIDDELPVLSLDCAVEIAMDGIILEHIDHVVKVNEGVIDGDDVHFARIKSSPGDQAPNAAESEGDARREGVRRRGFLLGTEAAPSPFTLFQRRGHSVTPAKIRENSLYFS